MSKPQTSPQYGFRSRTRMFRVPNDDDEAESDSEATVTDTNGRGDGEGDENGSKSPGTADSVDGDSDKAASFGRNEGDKNLPIVRWSSGPRTGIMPPSDPNCRVSYFRNFSQAIQRFLNFQDGLSQCMDYWVALLTDAHIFRRARVGGSKRLSIEIRDLMALVLFVLYDLLVFVVAVLSTVLRLVHTLMELGVGAWNCYALAMGMTAHVLEFD